MKILYKLYWLQLKGHIRYVFSKPGSAIFTLFIILLYGGLMVYSLCNPLLSLSMMHLNDLNAAVMLNIGFSAMMIVSILLQKKVAMFTEDDAFYLFTGPFKRTHVMQFLIMNVLVSAFLFSAINIVMLALLGRDLAYDAPFLLLAFACQFMLYYFFLIVQYYFYLLSIENTKMKHVTRGIILALVVFVGTLFLFVLAQHGFQMKEGFQAFINSETFYFLPVLGWIKMVLISYVTQNYGLLVTGIVLLLASCAIIYRLIKNYKSDFVEQAMMDAEEFTARYKQVKEGKATSMGNTKVKAVNASFKEGAAAIFSKNMVLMKKTRTFIQVQEVIVIVIYLAITIFMDTGFTFFAYMLIFWMFNMIMNSDFMRDMKNYQIYLIPDKPFKKLLYTMLPTLLKLVIVLLVFLIGSNLIFQETWLYVIQYFVMLSGYGLLFMSASVVSLRIMKSRNSVFMNQMMGMLIMILSAIPGTLLLLWLVSSGTLSVELMNITTIANLAINFVIAFILLYSCRNMMNGREIL